MMKRVQKGFLKYWEYFDKLNFETLKIVYKTQEDGLTGVSVTIAISIEKGRTWLNFQSA